MRPFRVGLTGGLAAGKSTVAQWLREAGYTVVDADRLVADLYRSGALGARVVEQLFGSNYLQSNGAVDHQRLATLVFADPQARHRLESAIHPLVKQEFENLARRANSVVVLEAPLLVEAGFAADFDLVVTVEAAPETRIARAMARGLDSQEARARLDAQTDEASRLAAAHKILRNDGSLEALRSQVDGLVQEIERKIANA